MVVNVFEDANAGQIPQWTTFDRHRKAREWAGLEQAELAAAAGISRATISSTENGHRMPSHMTTRLWALATGVPEWWLIHGDEWAPWGSNPRPADYTGVGWDDNRITFAEQRELAPIIEIDEAFTRRQAHDSERTPA